MNWPGNGTVRVLLSIFTRFPFINGLTLLLLLSERANRENFPPFPPTSIYVQVFLFVLIGTGMSSNMRRHECTIVYAGQLLYLAYLVLTSPSLKYRPWLMGRMLIRIAGCVGVYLNFGYLSDRAMGKQLLRFAQIFMALFGLTASYSLLVYPEEYNAISYNVGEILGPTLNVALAALLAGAAILLFSEIWIKTALSALLFGAIGLLVLSDSALYYWTRRMGVDFWNHMRVVLDDVTVIAGLLLVLSGRRFYN